jgi:hypothetical protein
MSLSYRLNPVVRNYEIDSYEMVFNRFELLQHLLADFGIYIVGNAVDYAKAPYRAFRLQLLLVSESIVPLCQLLRIPSFILKVELYCRKVSSAIVTDISILKSVLSRPSSIEALSYLHGWFANRHLRKEKKAERVAKRALRVVDSDDDDDVTIATLIKRRTGFSTSCVSVSGDLLLSPPLIRKPISLSAPSKNVLKRDYHFLDDSEDVLFEKHSGSFVIIFWLSFDFHFF